MPIIPLYLLDPVESSDASLLSQFNFCNSDDAVLPFSTGTVSILDAQHLWGLVIGIAAVPLSAAIAAGLALIDVRSGDASLSLSSGRTSIAPLAEPGTLTIRSKPGNIKA